jgi:hypothetical protein
MSYLLLTITVFLLSLSNLWLWIKVTKLEDKWQLMLKAFKTLAEDVYANN